VLIQLTNQLADPTSPLLNAPLTSRSQPNQNLTDIAKVQQLNKCSDGSFSANSCPSSGDSGNGVDKKLAIGLGLGFGIPYLIILVVVIYRSQTKNAQANRPVRDGMGSFKKSEAIPLSPLEKKGNELEPGDSPPGLENPDDDEEVQTNNT